MFYAIIVSDELAGVKSLHIDDLLQSIASKLSYDISQANGCPFQSSVLFIQYNKR
jgi:hypothetical protein